MPFLVLILIASICGVVAGVAAWRYPRRAWEKPAPALSIAEKIGEVAEHHPAGRSALQRRLKPESATELALTIALLFSIGAGVILGLLAYLIRTNSHLIGFDNGVAKWGNRHATAFSTHALTDVTQLGAIQNVIVLAVVLAVVELIRDRSRWLVPFIVAVVGGEELLANVIKGIVDRTRPTFNPAAATLGPSFPSGHTTTAAAFWACAALLLGRQRSRPARSILAGAAVAIGVGVACSRVLLDVHWLTDVLGGLLLGWGWFAVCGIAFGGRVVSFGAAAEVAARAATPPRQVPRPQPPGPRR
ncbi:MAG TPA: phosphatase PAP2 family protein [Gaiellaceae bacterium]|nr:phosphatase PAP2 family protein [Gaiellaceae bacterium]